MLDDITVTRPHTCASASTANRAALAYLEASNAVAISVVDTKLRRRHPHASGPSRPDSAQETDIFTKIERLADLHKKGTLSSEEFSAKKAELLSRL